jgi:hypothetical protein
MNNVIGLILAFSLAGCATCKSTDSPEVCRTKQREHGQAHTLLSFVPAGNNLSLLQAHDEFGGMSAPVDRDHE